MSWKDQFKTIVVKKKRPQTEQPPAAFASSGDAPVAFASLADAGEFAKKTGAAAPYANPFEKPAKPQ